MLSARLKMPVEISLPSFAQPALTVSDAARDLTDPKITSELKKNEKVTKPLDQSKMTPETAKMTLWSSKKVYNVQKPEIKQQSIVFACFSHSQRQ